MKAALEHQCDDHITATPHGVDSERIQYTGQMIPKDKDSDKKPSQQHYV